jgi:hypothetical protein
MGTSRPLNRQARRLLLCMDLRDPFACLVRNSGSTGLFFGVSVYVVLLPPCVLAHLAGLRSGSW